MTDINSYANNLLVEFLDSVHTKIKAILEQEFGGSWFEQGIEKHIKSEGIERTREMLNSPMATIDMGKTDEELYGVEHLSSIILGNWTTFEPIFHKRTRTEVYLGEIAELRHNVSHRRPHHLLQRGDLSRFVQNSHLLLRALNCPIATRFDSIATTLMKGDTPWGNRLAGTLPPATEIVSEFVGRESEMRALRIWLTAESERQLLIWGYGGSGKSALAYKFAHTVRDGAPSDFQAVVWLSAKSQEFVEGATRKRIADFDSIVTFGSGLWTSLYGFAPDSEEITSQAILDELNESPSLVIIDDLDTVLHDDGLTHFLLFQLPRTRSKFLYTTRQRTPGLPHIAVAGFDKSELQKYMRFCASEYDLDYERCVERTEAIHSVTNGFPLFVNDLMRHSMLAGLDSAIKQWTQRKGDAAREYALRKQLSSLGDTSKAVLVGISVANRPVSSLELSDICGYTDDDILQAIGNLLDWKLISRHDLDSENRQTFACNLNTQRLVQKTYGQDPDFKAYRDSFKSTLGRHPSPALRKAVGLAIGKTNALMRRGDYIGAKDHLRSSMTGELANNPDLWSMLGLVLSKERIGDAISEARKAFSCSHDMGSRNEDTYFHWIELEKDIAEDMVGKAHNDVLRKQWRVAAKVAEWGIERCGDTPSLCQNIAYLRNREAKTLEDLQQFTAAQTCFREAAEWARRDLDAPKSSFRDVDPSLLYRSLVIALGGVGDEIGKSEAMKKWRSVVGTDDILLRKEQQTQPH